MMSKLRNIQNSWAIKLILILTGLSFVSLFGITGYIGSAGKNKPIIKVDDMTVSQDEISQQYNQETQMAKNLFGDNLDLTENIRNSMLQGIVQRELIRTIIEKTADDLNVVISDDLVRKIIYSQSEFMDADGKFNVQKLRRLLSSTGWTEKRYIDTLKGDVEKQYLVQNVVENFNIPAVMTDYIVKIDNQNKVFKYIEIDPAKLNIDRKISAEELTQYYQDFATNFVEPESRDVSFITISTEEIAKNVKPSNEDIKAYYNDNISQFRTPETREVLQMAFENQEDADKAMTKIKNGEDFYAVALEVAKQDKKATDLGFVSKEMLIADMADGVFELNKGEVAGPVKSELGWHIMKVNDIKSGQETTIAQASSQITETLQKAQAYEEAYNVSKEIEDGIGAGKTLEDVAKDFNVKVYSVTGLGENGKAKSIPVQYKDLIAMPDFIDTAFSYNVNELSQVFESNDGFVVIKVDNITEAHPKEVSEVRPEIEKLWATNEKNAIAQEIVNDVMHDVENGDKIDEVASRFKLDLKTTKPLKRTENFENLTTSQMLELFQEDLNSPKLIEQSDLKIIAVGSQIIINNNKLNNDEIEVVKAKARSDWTQDVANQLINSYGSNYRIKVRYKQLGLGE